MADKYIALVGGVKKEVEAEAIGGSTEKAGKIPALDAAGRIPESMMPVGIGADVYVGAAAEILAANTPFVYIKADGEIASAVASSGGNPTIGFILDNFSVAADATVYFEGRVTGLSGLTPGARYYLSDTVPGGVTATPVSGAGKLHQYLGKAVTATTIAFEADDHIVRA